VTQSAIMNMSRTSQPVTMTMGNSISALKSEPQVSISMGQSVQAPSMGMLKANSSAQRSGTVSMFAGHNASIQKS